MQTAENKIPWRRLGEFIEECDERNEGGHEYKPNGLNIDKAFMPTVANLENVDLRKYKVVRNNRFVFSGMQTGRDECIRIGLFDEDKPVLISPAYTTFEIRQTSEVLPEFMYIQFLRKEMDRRGWFLSDSSIRANLDWNRFLDIEIPVPPLAVQQKVVDVWRGLRKMKEENDALAAPLMQLCRSYLQDCKKKWPMQEIGPMISERYERNDYGRLLSDSVRGLSTNKELIETVANLEGVSLIGYKVVSPNDFAYVADTSRRGDKVSYGFNASAETYLVSSISTVFEVVAIDKLSSEFLNLWLCRPEFDRYARFNSWGSARESFSFSDMCRVKIPLPPIEVQQAVVDVYRCASEAKKIAEEADRLSREICPALVRWAAEGGTA